MWREEGLSQVFRDMNMNSHHLHYACRVAWRVARPVRTHLVLLGGVGACLPALPPPAAPRLSWTTVDLLDMMAEAGTPPRGEGRESSRGGRDFLVGSIGV